MPTTASRIRIHLMKIILLSDAERAKDQVENVVGGGGAGDFVERAEGVVEVEEKHLVGDASGNGVGGAVQSGERVGDQFVVADVGEKSGFGGRGGAGDVVEDLDAEFGDAFAAESGGED